MSQPTPIVLITGASRGIGAELVHYFLKNSELRIVAVSRSIKEYGDLPEEYHHRFKVYQADISLSSEVNRLADAISKLGMVSYIINNAGLLINKPFTLFTDEEFQQMFGVNFFGPAMLIRELLPFLARPAHIVNITSMGGYQGSAKFPGLSMYSASKGALNILSECLAEEFKTDHIYVNALALGAVQTEMLEEAFPGYKAPVSAAEMAAFIADFTQNGYRLMNGKVLPVSLNTP
jgi:3-oxoacyl-[acyl-carrier protein] reductase